MTRSSTTGQRKRVMVTGASSGIGRATAGQLAGEGHRVFAVGRRELELSTLADEHPGIETVVLDVTSTAAVDAAYRKVEAATAGHGLDVLVNAAGSMTVGPVDSTPDASTRAQFEVNVFGLLSMTRAVIPSMRARRSGRIVNISSILGRFALPGSGLYAASKFAVEACSDALRMELAPHGVEVVVVEPGVTDTALGHEFPERLKAGAATPEEVASVITRVALVAKPRARYVVGGRNRLITRMLTTLPTSAADRTKKRVVGQG